MKNMHPVEWVIIAAIALIFATTGYALYTESQRTSFELKVDDWTCTKTKTETYLQPMIVDKTTILIPITTTSCIAYTRK